MFKRGMDSKGQLSVEYLLLLVVIFVVFGAMITYLIGPSIDAANDISGVSSASNLVNTLSNAANIVYSNGPGSKRTVNLYVPSNNMSFNRGGNYINLTYVNPTDGTNKTASAKTSYPIQSYQSTLNQGSYTFVIEWRLNENYIRVYKP
jgi:uncharacterized protein (UPF0333 family)